MPERERRDGVGGHQGHPFVAGPKNDRARADGTAVARSRMVASPAFDLSIAEVISYESLTIVVFRCECRWVVMLDRGPMVVACPGHGHESNGNGDN